MTDKTAGELESVTDFDEEDYDDEETWDEMNQLDDDDDGWNDDWPEDVCPNCGMEGWDCTCHDDDEPVKPPTFWQRLKFWFEDAVLYRINRLFMERDEVPF